MKTKMKIKKEDNVIVIAGNNKGETGRVLQVYPKVQRILIEGINVRKRHTRPNQQSQQGGILSKELPIHISNVALMDSDKNATRVGFRIEEIDGKKVSVRYAKSNDKKI
jgi:large subunit ribosomal protein L24